MVCLSGGVPPQLEGPYDAGYEWLPESGTVVMVAGGIGVSSRGAVGVAAHAQTDCLRAQLCTRTPAVARSPLPAH